MSHFAVRAKTVGKMLIGPPAFLFFSLIPWLIVAHFLALFVTLKEKGWSQLATFFWMSGIALGILIAAWTVFGLIFWLVQIIRVILGWDSRDEEHLA